MKRKQLILTLLALFASINAFAAIIDGIYYNFSGGEATVTNHGSNSYSGEVRMRRQRFKALLGPST